MDAGLTVYNSSNTVQIDAMYRNLSFNRVRTLSAGDQIINDPSALPRMSALYSETGIMCVPTWVQVGSHFISDYAYAVVGNGYFYDFEDIPIVETHAGLNVYKADGTICYSSGMKPLRVLYAGYGTLSSYADAILYSGVIATGRKVAVIVGQHPVCVFADGSSGKMKAHGKAIKVTTSTSGFVEVKFTDFYQITANVKGSQGNLNYNFLIVDITNF